MSTHQHRKRHNGSASCHGDPPASPVNNDHIHQGAPNLHGALNATGQQRHPAAQSQGLKQGRQVVLHGGGTAHLAHELQQRGSPEPCKEAGVCEKGYPRQS